MISLNSNQNYFLGDIGIFGFYIIHGIFASIIYIYSYIRLYRLNSKYLIIYKSFVVMFFVMFLFNVEFYSVDSILLTSALLYTKKLDYKY